MPIDPEALMEMRALVRVTLGLFLILHGLGHAVLPLRGFGPPIPPDTDWVPVVLYAVAMIGFVVAGLGVVGVRPLDRMISEFPIVRSAITTDRIPVWAAALVFTAFELPHFIMERRMLLNIKAAAEGGRTITEARRLAASPGPVR